MHILILNWRDIKNPKAGGAELLTHELAKRWVEKGNRVTQFSAGFPGGLQDEVIDGVMVMRRGSWWSVHTLAAFFYLTNRFGPVDIVIDEVHWFPFFSVFYAKNKTVLLACEVANKLFFKLFPFPFANLGRLVEKLYLSLYKNIPTLAISDSTKEDLVREGFSKQNISVIKLGITAPQHVKLFPKEKKPTVMFLGRMQKLKGVIDVVDMFRLVKKKIPRAQLWIAGYGSPEAIEDIVSRVGESGLADSTTVFGPVSPEMKFELLSRAHVLVVPSVHEGWGLIVPEAGSVGTASIAYNVPGLRDVVDDGITGILVDPTVSSLAQSVVSLLQNPPLLKQYSREAKRKAGSYNWDTTAAEALSVLERVHEKNL